MEIIIENLIYAIYCIGFALVMVFIYCFIGFRKMKMEIQVLKSKIFLLEKEAPKPVTVYGRSNRSPYDASKPISLVKPKPMPVYGRSNRSPYDTSYSQTKQRRG